MTAIGFLTLHFNDSPPFRVMGYIVAVGVVFALLLTVFFTAPLLITLPGKLPSRVSPLMSEDSFQMERLANFVIAKRYPLLVAILLVAGLLISLVPRNVINDDIVKYYTPETTFRKDMEFVNRHLTGIGEINYSLPAGGPDLITDPAYLKKVDEFSQWLKAQPDVTQVNSMADVIKRVNQVMHDNDPAFYRIPDSREEIAQYLLQYEMSLPYGMDLNYLLRFDRSESRVRVAVGTSSGQRIIAVDKAASAWLKQHAPAQQAQGASLSLMFAHIGERSITGMFGGMIGSLVVESLFVMLVFGALRLGLASFVGNLVPIGMAFGAWGFLNGNIDLGLTIVLGISFSVVVDDTIHFIHKYEHARRSGLSPEDAIRMTFRRVGFALMTASAKARIFSSIAFPSKLALPMPAWTMPAFSTRNSTAPPLASLTAWATFGVTVPTFGFGIRPRGPSTLPRRPTRAIMSGDAMTRSKSMKPPLIFSYRSSAPTTSAPAARASAALASLAKTATRTSRPVPDGRFTTPRTCWSA